MRKGFTPVIVIVGICLLLTITEGIYLIRLNSGPILPAISLPSPKPSPVDTTNWKTYISLTNKYSLQYPQELEPKEETPYTTRFQYPDEKKSSYLQTFLVSVMPDSYFNSGGSDTYISPTYIKDLLALEKGQQLSQDKATGGEKRLDDINVGGQNARVFSASTVSINFPGNARIVLFKIGDINYIIGTLYAADSDLNNFNQLLATFRLTN